jgi:CDP-paratose 2-epimerase
VTPPPRSPRPFGFVEWFRPGEHARVARALDGMVGAGARFLRTHLSWAEYHARGGQDWYDWLIPMLGQRIELLPCVHYTPPSLSRTGHASGAPRRLRDFADFIDHVLTRYGAHFRHIELWNEPNNLLDWDWRDDPDWNAFCEMIGAAAYWARQRGFAPVLGGPCPFDPHWLSLMGERGVLGVVSAVGLHGFPGTWDSEARAWVPWAEQLATVRGILARFGSPASVWITEAGYSTWRHDGMAQARAFSDALAAGADRLYWYGWQDIAATVAVQEGLRFDERHYHLGVLTAAGRPKLLGTLLGKGGPDAVDAAVRLAAPAVARAARPVAIVGGAGFIGSNLADSLLADGTEVLVVDSLARPGVERNLAWLKDRHGARCEAIVADVRNDTAMNDALADASAVFHLAAQVAVTTSLEDPVEDFEVNARGTLNILEAVRRTGRRVPVIFSSTNKVYGGLEDIALAEHADRYLPEDAAIRAHGIGEGRPLAFSTPYGCSKGVADQYVLDYARSFGIPSAVLRMSCIYGPRQCGTEDQGWVAHFLIRAMAGDPVTLFGDGKQVRDLLYVEDAVAAYRGVLAHIASVSGMAFNLGGGSANAVSLRMVLGEIARLVGKPIEPEGAAWRAADQLYFVADTRRLKQATGWAPRVGWRDGLARLHAWLGASRAGLRDGVASRRRSA